MFLYLFVQAICTKQGGGESILWYLYVEKFTFHLVNKKLRNTKFLLPKPRKFCLLLAKKLNTQHQNI